MATLSVRSVPKEVYRALKDQAEAENRSINQQVIWLLKEGLKARPSDVSKVLANISRRRACFSKSGKTFSDSTKLLRKDRER